MARWPKVRPVTSSAPATSPYRRGPTAAPAGYGTILSAEVPDEESFLSNHAGAGAGGPGIGSGDPWDLHGSAQRRRLRGALLCDVGSWSDGRLGHDGLADREGRLQQ